LKMLSATSNPLLIVHTLELVLPPMMQDICLSNSEGIQALDMEDVIVIKALMWADTMYLWQQEEGHVMTIDIATVLAGNEPKKQLKAVLESISRTATIPEWSMDRCRWMKGLKRRVQADEQKDRKNQEGNQQEERQELLKQFSEDKNLMEMRGVINILTVEETFERKKMQHVEEDEVATIVRFELKCKNKIEARQKEKTKQMRKTSVPILSEPDFFNLSPISAEMKRLREEAEQETENHMPERAGTGRMGEQHKEQTSKTSRG